MGMLVVEDAEINLFFVISPEDVFIFFRLKQAFFCKQIEIDKIRVSRKSRIGSVWRISIAGRMNRQNLPERLSGLLQKISKLVSFFSQSADSIPAWKRSNVKQDAAFSHKISFLQTANCLSLP